MKIDIFLNRKPKSHLETSRQIQIFQFLATLSCRQILQSSVGELLAVSQAQELYIMAVPKQRPEKYIKERTK